MGLIKYVDLISQLCRGNIVFRVYGMANILFTYLLYALNATSEPQIYLVDWRHQIIVSGPDN
jgi:hypothetical protein